MMDSVGGMTAYVKAFNKIQESVDIFNRQSDEIRTLENRISSIETIAFSLTTVSDLSGRIDRLYNLYDGSTFEDIESLLESIESNSKKIRTILASTEKLIIPYDTSVIRNGSGIDIVTDEGCVDVCLDKRYAMDVPAVEDMRYSVELNQGKNLMVLDSLKNTSDTINLIISNDSNEWEIGQTFRICWTGEMSNDMEISVGNNAISISGTDLNGKNSIEIVCIGDDNFIHLIK